MKSLRDTMETAYAAAAFAERNLDKEAREVLGKDDASQLQPQAKRTAAKTKRPRPSLKA